MSSYDPSSLDRLFDRLQHGSLHPNSPRFYEAVHEFVRFVDETSRSKKSKRQKVNDIQSGAGALLPFLQQDPRGAVFLETPHETVTVHLENEPLDHISQESWREVYEGIVMLSYGNDTTILPQIIGATQALALLHPVSFLPVAARATTASLPSALVVTDQRHRVLLAAACREIGRADGEVWIQFVEAIASRMKVTLPMTPAQGSWRDLRALLKQAVRDIRAGVVTSSDAPALFLRKLQASAELEEKGSQTQWPRADGSPETAGRRGRRPRRPVDDVPGARAGSPVHATPVRVELPEVPAGGLDPNGPDTRAFFTKLANVLEDKERRGERVDPASLRAITTSMTRVPSVEPKELREAWSGVASALLIGRRKGIEVVQSAIKGFLEVQLPVPSRLSPERPESPACLRQALNAVTAGRTAEVRRIVAAMGLPGDPDAASGVSKARWGEWARIRGLLQMSLSGTSSKSLPEAVERFTELVASEERSALMRSQLGKQELPKRLSPGDPYVLGHLQQLLDDVAAGRLEAVKKTVSAMAGPNDPNVSASLPGSQWVEWMKIRGLVTMGLSKGEFPKTLPASVDRFVAAAVERSSTPSSLVI